LGRKLSTFQCLGKYAVGKDRSHHVIFGKQLILLFVKGISLLLLAFERLASS